MKKDEEKEEEEEEEEEKKKEEGKAEATMSLSPGALLGLLTSNSTVPDEPASSPSPSPSLSPKTEDPAFSPSPSPSLSPPLAPPPTYNSAVVPMSSSLMAAEYQLETAVAELCSPFQESNPHAHNAVVFTVLLLVGQILVLVASYGNYFAWAHEKQLAKERNALIFWKGRALEAKNKSGRRK